MKPESWKLTGKPHWPLTTYEKVWGFWHLAGWRILLGIGFIFGPYFFFLFIGPIQGPLSAQPPLAVMVLMFPMMEFIAILIGAIGVLDWWQVIHGTVPDPGPFARPLAWIMNEPDPYKEQAELQARLDEAKTKSVSNV